MLLVYRILKEYWTRRRPIPDIRHDRPQASTACLATGRTLGTIGSTTTRSADRTRSSLKTYWSRWRVARQLYSCSRRCLQRDRRHRVGRDCRRQVAPITTVKTTAQNDLVCDKDHHHARHGPKMYVKNGRNVPPTRCPIATQPPTYLSAVSDARGCTTRKVACNWSGRRYSSYDEPFDGSNASGRATDTLADGYQTRCESRPVLNVWRPTSGERLKSYANPFFVLAGHRTQTIAYTVTAVF